MKNPRSIQRRKTCSSRSQELVLISTLEPIIGDLSSGYRPKGVTPYAQQQQSYEEPTARCGSLATSHRFNHIELLVKQLSSCMPCLAISCLSNQLGVSPFQLALPTQLLTGQPQHTVCRQPIEGRNQITHNSRKSGNWEHNFLFSYPPMTLLHKLIKQQEH